MAQKGFFARIGALVGPKKKTVLVAWEMGAGMGHLHRLYPLAQALEANGLRMVFAFRETASAGFFSEAFPGAPILLAPHHTWHPAEPENRDAVAYNYADVLYRSGYALAECLGPLVQSWREMIDKLEPALIVCDHSPSVVLAAAGRVPVAHLGSGFSTPPVGKPFLTLHEKSLAGAEDREAQVLATVREVQTKFGAPVPMGVSSLLGTAENFTCSLPELDPYRGVRDVPGLGPVHDLPKPQQIGGPVAIFGYLAAEDERVRALVESLVKAGLRCRLFIRRAPSDWRRIVENSGVELLDTPQKLTEALAGATAVVHHGGLSTAETALAIGRPQFLLPRYLEQTLTTESIEKLGCGLRLRPSRIDPGEVIQKALKEGALADKARRVAERLAERPRPNAVSVIVESCLAKLNGDSKAPWA